MSIRSKKDGKELEALDRLIAEITVDAYDDDEQLWAFRQAFEDGVTLPADGFVIGEPVSVIAVDYDGNKRCGLTAKCHREDGTEYVVAVSEVVLPQTIPGADNIAAYRRWLGLEPYPAETKKTSRRRRQHKVADDDLDLSKAVELVVLSVKERVARCRLLRNDRIITLRASLLCEVVPGAIVALWRSSVSLRRDTIDSNRREGPRSGTFEACRDGHVGP